MGAQGGKLFAFGKAGNSSGENNIGENNIMSHLKYTADGLVCRGPVLTLRVRLVCVYSFIRLCVPHRSAIRHMSSDSSVLSPLSRIFSLRYSLP